MYYMIGNTFNSRTQIILEPQLKLRLFELADQKNISVSQMIRTAVVKTYFPKKSVDFIKNSFFGSWEDIKKSDKKLLEEIGGNWKNFPLE